MSGRTTLGSRGWVGSVVLVATVLLLGGGLAAWKYTGIRKEDAASANQPEPTESVTAAVASKRDYNATTTSVGTVLALRSITLRNELPGTVHQVRLVPGQIVERGALLVALDVSVEQAELEAEQAQAALAQTTLKRVQTLGQDRAVSQQEIDQALAQRDVALAQIARTRAIIARKTIRAPFRARMGISDVHEGQYLKEGDLLTTLQGVDEALHVDFTVAQGVAAGLKVGDPVQIVAAGEGSGDTPIPAKIVAIDSRVDPTTRNAMVRARIDRVERSPAPGASVSVRVPIGSARPAVAIPVSALRKGPGGDHVFVLAKAQDGKVRAHERQVQAGDVLGDEVIILNGLKPGEEVATSGSFKLRDAVLVAIQSDSAKAGKGAD
jgi:membrane fusion protein (multidrug efflux system)